MQNFTKHPVYGFHSSLVYAWHHETLHKRKVLQTSFINPTTRSLSKRNRVVAFAFAILYIREFPRVSRIYQFYLKKRASFGEQTAMERTSINSQTPVFRKCGTYEQKGPAIWAKVCTKRSHWKLRVESTRK